MALATTTTATDWWDSTLTTGNLSDGQLVIVQGYYSRGDGGGGRYVYRTSQQGSALENGGTIVRINDGTHANFLGAAQGWFYLLHDGVVTLKQFGAVGDNTDRAFNATVNSHRRFPSSNPVPNLLTRYLGSSTPTPVGRAFELIEETDTLDWVSIQSAFDTALRLRSDGGGFRIVGDVGRYIIRKAIWVGWGEHDEQRDSGGDPSFDQSANEGVHMGGFVFEGVNLTTGANGTSPRLATVIQLVTGASDTDGIVNRFTLRLPSNPAHSTDTFKLRPMWGDYSTTAAIQVADTGSTIAATLSDLPHIWNTGGMTPQDHATATNGTSSTALNSQKLIVIKIDKSIGDSGHLANRSFHGEIQTAWFENLDGSGLKTYDPTNWGTGSSTKYVRCYADSGIISFRGLAQKNVRIANVNLVANAEGPTSSDPETVTDYVASFGILQPHSQFTKFEFENVFVRGCRWAFGLLEGNAVNGENTTYVNCQAEQCYGLFYCNAGQALQSKFLAGTALLDGPFEEDTVRYAVEVGGGRMPGYDISFIDFGLTMLQNVDPDTHETVFSTRNCLLRFKSRGSKTGIITWRNSRSEHIHTFVEWDNSDNGQDLQVKFDGVDFDGIIARTTHPLVRDLASQTDTSGDYAVEFRNCRLSAWINEHDSADDQRNFLTIEGSDLGRGVVGFRNCYFNEFAGRDVRVSDFFFSECRWRQRSSSLVHALNERALANTRAGSLADLPRAVSSGPSMNRLLWSAHPCIDAGDNSRNPVSPWVVKNSSGTDVPFLEFQKNGRSSASNDPLGLTAVSASSFAFSLTSAGHRLAQQLVALEGAPDVVTYEAFVQVLNGSMTFSLADGSGDSAVVFDSVLVREGSWRLVTLTAVGGDFQEDPPTLRIHGEATGSAVQVAWQAAYHGVGPFSPVLTEATEIPTDGSVPAVGNDLEDQVPPSSADDEHWSHVLSDLRVPDRLQIPYKKDIYGYRATSTGDSPDIPDLRSGEVYLDGTNGAMMMFRGGDWFVVGDVARWADVGSSYTWDVTDVDHNHRFLVLPTGSASTIDLMTEEVPNGMRVTAFNRTSSGTITLRSKTGGSSTTIATVAHGEAVTVVYRNTGGTGPQGWYLESRYS
ncbi:MAG: hypothetical protein JSS66_14565 [Armatimonadetes bacterium]|nr:hypothetical protein [Armatimonadota bacterium]